MATVSKELIPIDLDGAWVSDRFERWLARTASVLPVKSLRRVAEIFLAIFEPTRFAVLSSEPLQSEARPCGQITVLSSNLLHDFPFFRNKVERLERFQKLVEDLQPDIILAQELYRTPNLQSVTWLADRLEMAYIYARANGSLRLGFEEGVGVFSRFPLGQPTVHQMNGGIGPITRRLALGVPVMTPCGEFHVFNIHLSLIPLANRYQLRHLPEWICKIADGSPFLAGGDFNTNEKSGHLRPFLEQWTDTYRHIHPDGDDPTYEMRWPWGKMRRERLDYLFLGNGSLSWEIVDTQHIVNPYGPHSDHHAVVTHLMPVSLSGTK